MNRRGFFKAIGAIVATAVAAPLLPMLPAAPAVETISAGSLFGVDFEWSDIESALALERSHGAFDRLHYLPFHVGEVVSVNLPERYRVNG